MKRDAVSEVVGAMVLVAIAMLVMAILALVIFANPLPTRVPSFAGFISNSSRTIYISHEGGDPLLWGQYKILVDNVDETLNFTKSLDASRNFSVGKVMNATLPKLAKRVVVIFNSSWGGGTMLLSADLTKTQVQVPYGWFSPDWSYRKKITIDHNKVPSDQIDFPVLYYDGSTDLAGSHTQNPSGNDILFTDSTGMNKLSHEIEYFTHNDGTLYAWVKVPSLSHTTNTVIYMYYGNSGAPNQQNAADVWSNGYLGVYHLNNAFTSSTGSNNGADTGTGDAAGQIGRGRSFDGTGSQFITITGYFGGPATVTLSAWAKLTTADTKGAEVISVQNNVSLRMDGSTGGWGTNGFFFNLTGKTWAPTTSGMYLAGSGWHYLTYVCNPGGSSEIINIDGVSRGTTSWGEGIQYRNGIDTFIGKHSALTTYDFNGVIDEVRVSNVVRLPDWITTENYNQGSPGTFYTAGTPQTPSMMS